MTCSFNLQFWFTLRVSLYYFQAEQAAVSAKHHKKNTAYYTSIQQQTQPSAEYITAFSSKGQAVPTVLGGANIGQL